jgi:hypothetical protein
MITEFVFDLMDFHLLTKPGLLGRKGFTLSYEIEILAYLQHNHVTAFRVCQAKFRSLSFELCLLTILPILQMIFKLKPGIRNTLFFICFHLQIALFCVLVDHSLFPRRSVQDTSEIDC